MAKDRSARFTYKKGDLTVVKPNIRDALKKENTKNSAKENKKELK